MSRSGGVVAAPSAAMAAGARGRAGGVYDTAALTSAMNSDASNRRSRELGVLLQYVSGWLVQKVYLQPPFIKALVDQNQLKMSDKESVDKLVRTMLDVALDPNAEPSPNGDLGALDSLYAASAVPGDDKKRTARVQAYVNVLNGYFGQNAPFELTPQTATPFTSAQVEGILANGERATALSNTVLINQGLPSAAFLPNGPLLFRPAGGAASPAPAAGVAPANGGAAALAAGRRGGDGEVMQYVPTIPRVSEVRRSETPCMYERKVQKGEGFWSWKCERTNQPGVKKCHLVRVEKESQTLVPIQCLQEYVNVLKGFEVQKSTVEDPVTGNKTVRQTITPEVQVYGTVTARGPAGPAIPYRDLPKYTEAYPVPPKPEAQQNLPIAVLGNPVSAAASGRDLGGGGATTAGAAAPTRAAGGRPATARATVGAPGGAAPRAGAAVNGGAVALPRRTDARNSQFYLTNKDIEDITTGVPADMMPKPASWANINPPENPNEIAFYTTDDSYGTASTRRQQNGFSFSFKYLPYAYMLNQAYLEWLVSLDYKMRVEFPDEHQHTYDPLWDTIATVETAIMVTLGRLEAKGQYFNRQDLFQGKEPFREVMHRYLRYYAFTPPQNTWYSPLSARYSALPTVKADGTPAVAGIDYPVDEQKALDALKDLHDAIIMTAITGLPDDAPRQGGDGGFRIPLKYRGLYNVAGFAPPPGAGQTTFKQMCEADSRVVGMVEDEVLSLLARLQYIHGFAINMASTDAVPTAGAAIGAATSIADIATRLLDIKVRRFLTRELVRYLEMFSLDSGAPALHRLPALRMREAAERGLVLPKSAMSQYGADWAAANRAALPGLARGLRPGATPASRYEIAFNQPNFATAAAAAGGGAAAPAPRSQRRR